jgi:hypothetical protein
MIFAPGKVESVHYLNGADPLKKMADLLQATKFEAVFPANSGARIFRRVTLSCSSTSGCNAEMVAPTRAIVVTKTISTGMVDD